MLKQQKTANPTSEGYEQTLPVSFDGRLKLEFHVSKITPDEGLLVYRERDGALELTAMTSDVLRDKRAEKNTQHSMVASMRRSIFSRLAGDEDTNDADLVSGRSADFGDSNANETL